MRYWWHRLRRHRVTRTDWGTSDGDWRSFYDGVLQHLPKRMETNEGPQPRSSREAPDFWEPESWGLTHRGCGAANRRKFLQHDRGAGCRGWRVADFTCRDRRGGRGIGVAQKGSRTTSHPFRSIPACRRRPSTVARSNRARQRPPARPPPTGFLGGQRDLNAG